MAFLAPLVARNKCFVTADNIERFPGEKPGSILRRHGSGQMGPGFSPGQRSARRNDGQNFKLLDQDTSNGTWSLRYIAVTDL
jgi:hypothetical protein